jgi:hypothetical protein
MKRVCVRLVIPVCFRAVAEGFQGMEQVPIGKYFSDAFRMKVGRADDGRMRIMVECECR